MKRDWKKIFAALLFTGLWILRFYPEIQGPWIRGWDAQMRLLHINEWVVVNAGDPWLPMLQILIKTVHFFTDQVLAYKLLVNAVSWAGAMLFLSVLYEVFGSLCAAISALYFLTDWQWWFTSSSLYMEPVLLLFVSLALRFHLDRRKPPAILCWIASTFCRPELLLAAPVIVCTVFYRTRSTKSAAKTALIFLPVIFFYVILRWKAHLFTTPGAPDWKMSALIFHCFFFPLGLTRFRGHLRSVLYGVRNAVQKQSEKRT
jgi:hypothetical protein